MISYEFILYSFLSRCALPTVHYLLWVVSFFNLSKRIEIRLYLIEQYILDTVFGLVGMISAPANQCGWSR